MLLDEEHKSILSAAGALEERRERQNVRWMWSMLDDRLIEKLRQHRSVQRMLPELESQVKTGQMNPVSAVSLLLNEFLKTP